MDNIKDYQGTIFLKNNLGLQEIYSSQNYGTFYSIYMSFDCERNICEDSKIVTLKNLQFKIVNYKGLINLGIVNIIPKPKSSDKEYVFEIEVEGAVSRRSYNLSKEKPMYSTIEIDLDKFKHIIIQRTLLKMSSFNENINPNDPQNLIFDDEFFYRDGLKFDIKDEEYVRPKRGGMDGSGSNSSGKRCFTVAHKIAP